MTVISSLYRIPRSCLGLLLLAQVAVLLPHVTRLPIWITAVYLLATLWRVVLHAGRGVYPPRWARGLMVFVGVTGIFFSYESWFAVEPVVAMLIVSSALKLIEVRNRRDVMVVICLAYAVAATAFLFGERIGITIYIVLCIMLITAALVSLHEDEANVDRSQAIWKATKLLSQAAPLMLILFIAFPRIAPLWGVPDARAGGQTGPGDTMSPGDISELASSSALAFRVSFDGDTPMTSSLYWRGLVLNHFDGRRWSQHKKDAQWRRQPATDIRLSGEPVQYTVLIEPNQQRWLYAIPAMRSLTTNVVVGANATLRHRVKIARKFSYSVKSWPQYHLEPTLDTERFRLETALPENVNPRARKLASELKQQSSNDRDIVNQVLKRFNQQQFIYTLSPGLLGNNSVDEFLFETRRGFCEHYAGALVFLLRAADIPARVVVGYQGGEVNEYNNYVLVHQYDAHAWAEVWLSDRGWTRVDPTSAVAPDRIESGMRDIWQEDQQQRRGGIGSLWKLHSLPGLYWARMQWDSVNYTWSKWVVGYDSARQNRVLKDWLGDITAFRMFLFVCGGGALVLALVAVVLLRTRTSRNINPIDRLYIRHTQALADLGIVRGNGESALNFAERVAVTIPGLAEPARQLAKQYSDLRYTAASGSHFNRTSSPDLAHFRLLVSRFKKLCRRQQVLGKRNFLRQSEA